MKRQSSIGTLISRHGGARVFAIWAVFMFVGWAGACGKSSPNTQKLPDASSGGAGGSKADAAADAGGAIGTGGVAGDAGTGSGGTTGTGGMAGDAGVTVACSDDGGVGLAAVARQCTQDSDCTIQIAARCCGADQALGIAKAQASAYSGCLVLAPGACNGLGCPKFLGYLTDTGKTTPFEGAAAQPLDSVAVRCVGHLCTTDVVSPADARRDAPPAVDSDDGLDASAAVDAAPDAANNLCGNTTCRPGQTCVLSSGGPVPRCVAPVDGGCPIGMAPAASCGGGYLPALSPGCTDPVWTPGCVDIPDACDDLCSCLCHLSATGGCYPGPSSLSCSYQ